MTITLKPSHSANVLLLSNNMDMRDMWHVVLQHQCPDLQFHHARCDDVGEALVRELAPDVIIVESSWPTFSGLTSLRKLKADLDSNTLLLGMSFDQPNYKEDMDFRSICDHIFEHPVQINGLHRYIRQFLNRSAYASATF